MHKVRQRVDEILHKSAVLKRGNDQAGGLLIDLYTVIDKHDNRKKA